MCLLLVNADFPNCAGSDQTLPFLAVFAFFGLCFFYVLYSGYLRKVSWRNDEIRQSFLGKDTCYQLSSITSIKHNGWAGTLRLTFVDGTKLDVSEMMDGVGELYEHIETIIF